MTGIRWISAMLVGMTLTADASAQIIQVPPPVVGVPVLVPNGVGFTYNSRRLKVAGFVGTGGVSTGLLPVSPYGVPVAPYYYYPGYAPVFPPVILGAVETRTTLQIINPPGLVQSRRGGGLLQQQDVSGIDLDVEPAAKIWGNKPPAVRVAPAKAEAVPKDERKDEPKPIKEQPIPPPLPPKADLVPEAKRLIDNGILAFRNGEYGIATLRFRQVAEDDPTVPRAVFLQAHAHIATGKYREAAQLIEQALVRQPDWLKGKFRPRVELYGNDERWKQHITRLEQAQLQQPKNADYLFLLGYMFWFDGDRDAALAYFRSARPLATDPRTVDLFLNAGK